MRLLITGGAGCLGSNLIERYFPLGHEICVIDNFATGKREVVPEQERLTVVEGSIVDMDLVKQHLRSFSQHMLFTALRPTRIHLTGMKMRRPMLWAQLMWLRRLSPQMSSEL